MKKIPTLFKRTFEGRKVVSISDEVTPGMEWVLAGEGKATIKYDGSCVALLPSGWYKRFDAKPGRKIPEGAIPCCEPDPVTGHHPHWVPIIWGNPADKWYCAAIDYQESKWDTPMPCGTYEAVGPHFQNNPYFYSKDQLLPHGKDVVYPERTFQGIKRYLATHSVEGLVFWKDGAPQCKIKRSDFGFPWPIRED